MAGLLVKWAAKPPEVSYGLAGRLFLSQSGWLMLSVPNAVVRGLYDALDEPGAELWLDDDGKLNAHITVMHKDEVERIGPERITERGHTFRYTLGRLKRVKPRGLAGYSDVWFVEVKSPALEKLRKSYGLPNRPKDNEFEFHITVARRKSGVLRPGAKSKAAASDAKERPKTVAVDLDGTLATHYETYDPDRIPDPRPGAKEEMERLRKMGVRLIIHTVRGETDTVQKWLEEHEIPFDHINENPDQPPKASSKLYADVYVDDRAVSAKPPLGEVFAEVRRRLAEEKQAELTVRQQVAYEARKARKPTPAQAEAGNYRKGHVRWGGLEIAIETPAGERRRPEWPRLKYHYGYIKRTEGRDGDHVDVILGPHLETELVFVVNQTDPETGKFDEHKCVIGARNEAEAKEIYSANYSKGWKGMGSVVALTLPQFKQWLAEGDTKKPLAAPGA